MNLQWNANLMVSVDEPDLHLWPYLLAIAMLLAIVIFTLPTNFSQLPRDPSEPPRISES